MGHPVLRLYDGYDHTSPQLREEVRGLQEGLCKLGLLPGADGYFGPGTEEAVKGFQRANGLYDDDVVGPLTWAALLGTRPPDPAGTFWTTYAKEDA
jgi:peptidoglycan hydrolase-like protein with peptidoglycan-binding domain